jgi:hypothetical protein
MSVFSLVSSFTILSDPQYGDTAIKPIISNIQILIRGLKSSNTFKIALKNTSPVDL